MPSGGLRWTKSAVVQVMTFSRAVRPSSPSGMAGRLVPIPLLRTVSTPLLPSPSVPVRAPHRPRARHARTHSGRRRPANAPRTASALVSGG